MSDTINDAQEGLEHAHHAAREGHGGATRVAVLIAILAAALALAEMNEKSHQNEYLSRHVEVSDTYAFFQAKSVRVTVRTAEAELLASLPNADQPTIAARIAAARAEIERLRDEPTTGEGTKQLAERAKRLTEQRDEALHTYHHYERVVGALQIAIVLASVSVVTRVRWLTWGAATLGGAACLYGVVIASLSS